MNTAQDGPGQSEASGGLFPDQEGNTEDRPERTMSVRQRQEIQEVSRSGGMMLLEEAAASALFVGGAVYPNPTACSASARSRKDRMRTTLPS